MKSREFMSADGSDSDLHGPILEAGDVRRQIDRLAWLCGELAAGNAFSPEQLRKWEAEARAVLLQRGK
jgi:hypothetical protein